MRSSKWIKSTPTPEERVYEPVLSSRLCSKSCHILYIVFCIIPRPDEESDSTEWETDTDASDEEEADGEQARTKAGCHAFWRPWGNIVTKSNYIVTT